MLVVLGLSAALVAPVLVPPSKAGPVSIQRVIAQAQRTSLRRGETLVLEVSESGAWRIVGSASPEEGALESGTLSGEAPSRQFSLRIAPVGSCSMSLQSDAGSWSHSIDLLTCRTTAR